MYLYYDKNLNLRTKIDHGEKIRQGSDFEVVLCLDEDFEFETRLYTITTTIKYDNEKIGNDIISEKNEINVFKKIYPNENTSDLIDGVSYWMYYFKFSNDPYTKKDGQIVFNATISFFDDENVLEKELTFGSANLFVEKTIGFGKQSINLSNNYYEKIKEELRKIDAKKADRNEIADEEIIVIDGKPILVSKEFIDLINNETLNENLDKINQLFESFSKKPYELQAEIIGESVVPYRSLKNTKWTFNDVIDFNDTIENVELNFVSNFEGFSEINLEKTPENNTMYFNDLVVYDSEWKNILYKNIEIVDGKDVENIEVIAWLQKNAICTATPNDEIKYSLLLSGDVLTLVGNDGVRSSVTLKYVDLDEFENASRKILDNENEIKLLKNRVLEIENSAPEGEIVVTKYVVNTVNDLIFKNGIQETVNDGDLLVSLKTINNENITANELKVGDVIYNKQLNQPDLWISERIAIGAYNDNLTNSEWIISTAFPQDCPDFLYDLNFVSNEEQFVKIGYNNVEYVGLAFIKSDGSFITVYNNSDGIWNDDKYQTIFINGGSDVKNADAINLLKLIAQVVSSDANVYAKISILETEKVDLEDYLRTSDVSYQDNLEGQLNVETVGTLTIKGVEHEIKVKKVSGSGTGLTSEQEAFLDNLVVESNSGYSAGTQRMVAMVYENIVDSAATKGQIVTLPIPNVGFQQKITNGTEIGTLSINGNNIKLYAPSGGTGQGGVSEERVQEMINNAISNILMGDC